MKDWRRALIPPTANIRTAIDAINRSAVQTALVVGEDMRLLGLVVDGDVRRAILSNMSLDRPVTDIMSTSFTAARPDDHREHILQLMYSKDLRHIPVVDAQGRLLDLKTLIDITRPRQRPNRVLLMAGGQGMRLRPMTEQCPKPLLRVGGKPVLETIIEGFREYGFWRFYISVHYRAEMIEAYFGDGSRLGVEITYLREGEGLGTAGCLSLFPERPAETFLVMNGDILNKINFEQFLCFHQESGAMATMGVREYKIQVPYGVVKVRDHRVVAMREKPVHKHFVNAGVYALEPGLLDRVRPGERLDMPDLLAGLLPAEGVAAFPVHEYWMDIGHKVDFDRANGEFLDHFS